VGRRAAIIAVTVVAAAGGIVLSSTPSGGGGGSDTFNAFVQSGGGTCVRASTAIVFADIGTNGVDEVCGTFNQAVDAMSSGDTAEIQAGTYAAQAIDGDKTSLTRLIAAGDGDDVIVSTDPGGPASGFQDFSWCAICIDSNYVSVENLTAVTDDPGPFGGVGIWGSNDRLMDVDIRGLQSDDPDSGDFYAGTIGINGPNFTYLRGQVGRTSSPYETTTCDNATVEPIWFMSGSAGGTIDGVTVGGYIPLDRARTEGGGDPCSGDPPPHVETVRLDDADNITIRNSYFNTTGGDHGSGHIFTRSDSDNLLVYNTRFAARCCGNPTIAADEGNTASGWVIAYNTFDTSASDGFNLPAGGDTIIVGNYGGDQLACSGGGRDILNKFSGSGSCGTNTYTGATDLQLDANLLLESGSAPAVDGGETPGASDYCTDAAGVNSLDYEGDTRPAGSVCDAGADEF
jgi:hypothetical protein